jgi:hypothetical protein
LFGGTFLIVLISLELLQSAYAFQSPQHANLQRVRSGFGLHAQKKYQILSQKKIVGRYAALGAGNKRTYQRKLLTAPYCSLQQPDNSIQSKVPKFIIWTAWALYMFHIFLSDAPCGPGATGDLCGIGLPATVEALQLSFNFWFVAPLAFPSIAPVLHPALEGLFNAVVAWGGLFFGLLSDGRRQRVPMLPFLVGTAFLTNVFYLPYLGLRGDAADLASAAAPAAAPPPPSALSAAESRWWPALMTAVLAASVLWACYGRAAGIPGAADAPDAAAAAAAAWGDPAARWAALSAMATRTDRLAHSFLVDCLTFWAFQGALIPDDLRRRGLDPARGPGAAAVALGWLVPFLGLAGYLAWRPPLLPEAPDSDGVAGSARGGGGAEA